MGVSTNPDEFGFDTRQVHAGEAEERNHNARITPIYLTVAYLFDDFAQAEDGDVLHGWISGGGTGWGKAGRRG